MKNTIKNVRVYTNGDSIRYRIEFKDAFDGIQVNNGEYADAQVNYVDFVPRHLIAVVISQVPGVDLIYTASKEQALKTGEASSFGAAQLGVILRDAEVSLERTRFEAGDEYVTGDGEVCTHEHHGYNTELTDIKVSNRIQQKLDSILDKMLGF